MKGLPVDGNTPKGKEIPCFRCGVCCMKYSPRATTAEAEHIAESLGISLEDFLDRYIDDSWFEPGFYLLDSQDGACIFLAETDDKRVYSCLIHTIRPRVCREWQPGFDRKECLKGLEKYWRLTINLSGELSGPEEKVQEFWSVIE
jgi:Fe-S-cluster containining protein